MQLTKLFGFLHIKNVYLQYALCICVCVLFEMTTHSRFVHNNNVIVLEFRPGPVPTGCRPTATREWCLRASPLCRHTCKKGEDVITPMLKIMSLVIWRFAQFGQERKPLV